MNVSHSKLRSQSLMAAPLVTGDTSDGFHTFNDLYDHRCSLFLSLMKCLPSISWYSKMHDDGSVMGGWFVAGINLPTGAITYHLPLSMWDLAGHTGAESRIKAPKWDGHTSHGVVKRLQMWVARPANHPKQP